MEEKESTQNHLWFTRYSSFKTRDLSAINSKLTRGFSEKNGKRFRANTPARGESVFWQRRQQKTLRLKEQRG